MDQRTTRRHHTRIRSAIREAIARKPNADADEIKTTVVETLKGEYRSAFLTLLMPVIIKLILEMLRKK